nr:MAG TPA: hypothetical protein [Caudoviricetes sp.]
MPSRSILAGETPRADTSSPVERDSSLVSRPMTACKLERTFSRTTSPPASSTFGRISSVLSPSRESFKRKSSGILICTLAICRHHLFR